jgi:galactose oxidase
MRPTRMMTRCFLPSCAILALAVWAKPANAQVQEVVVGVTMTCPYENAIEGSCWSGAYWALMQLEDVKTVDKSANGYNCTARVYLKNDGFPDPDKWALQFKKLVDQTYTFRGVEITVGGTVAGDASGLVLRVDGVERPLTLRTLEHKLQWNSKKGAARQLEPDEHDAYNQLASKIKDAKGGELKAKVTGPLRKTDAGYTLEVREFFPLTK